MLQIIDKRKLYETSTIFKDLRSGQIFTLETGVIYMKSHVEGKDYALNLADGSLCHFKDHTPVQIIDADLIILK